jgi:uncharacterized membrane protein YgdD (TMEM256/DUF423 family)
MIANTKNQYLIAGLVLLVAVILGAFGAHGLKEVLTAKTMVTYKTGISYQFYHGFALLLMPLISQVTKIDLSKPFMAFLIGVILFSFNCYIYSVTLIKPIAMIIPLGGIMFMAGWIIFIYKIFKSEFPK